MASEPQSRKPPSPTTSVRVYGVCVREARVLLVRSSNPSFDPPMWWLPGGGIRYGESPLEALAREFDEETGVSFSEPRLMQVMSDMRPRATGEVAHTIRIIYSVHVAGGELRHEPFGTTDRAEWFALHELDGLRLAHYARESIELFVAK